MALLTLSPDQRSDLEYLASHAPLARQRCRALALLWLDEGDSVDRVAEALRVSRRTVYYWADRLRERPDPELSARLADAPRSGRPRTADGDIDSWIARVIDTDPHEFGHGATTWTAPLLVRYLRDHHQVEVSRRTVSRAPARLRLRCKRPRHQLALRPTTGRQSKGG